MWIVTPLLHKDDLKIKNKQKNASDGRSCPSVRPAGGGNAPLAAILEESEEEKKKKLLRFSC